MDAPAARQISPRLQCTVRRRQSKASAFFPRGNSGQPAIKRSVQGGRDDSVSAILRACSRGRRACRAGRRAHDGDSVHRCRAFQSTADAANGVSYAYPRHAIFNRWLGEGDGGLLPGFERIWPMDGRAVRRTSLQTGCSLHQRAARSKSSLIAFGHVAEDVTGRRPCGRWRRQTWIYCRDRAARSGQEFESRRSTRVRRGLRGWRRACKSPGEQNARR
jgi:hypothetical protein